MKHPKPEPRTGRGGMRSIHGNARDLGQISVELIPLAVTTEIKKEYTTERDDPRSWGRDVKAIGMVEAPDLRLDPDRVVAVYACGQCGARREQVVPKVYTDHPDWLDTPREDDLAAFIEAHRDCTAALPPLPDHVQTALDKMTGYVENTLQDGTAEVPYNVPVSVSLVFKGDDATEGHMFEFQDDVPDHAAARALVFQIHTVKTRPVLEYLVKERPHMPERVALGIMPVLFRAPTSPQEMEEFRPVRDYADKQEGILFFISTPTQGWALMRRVKRVTLPGLPEGPGKLEPLNDELGQLTALTTQPLINGALVLAS